MRVNFCWRLAVLCVLISVLSGCKVELFSGLAEREGNEMLAILLSHNIPASKTLGKGDLISITVDEGDVAQAINIMQRNGFPRDDFADLGQIFQKQGLISSPLEERVRYIYGLSQTISETLNQIDGVLTARVHIVLPEEQPLDKAVRPSSASVFIKYRPGLGIEESVPKIKMIVQNSVEGLAYDKISVALFPAQDALTRDLPDSGPPLSSFLGLRIASDSLNQFMLIAAALAGLLVLAVAAIGFMLWRTRRSNQRQLSREIADV
jgi:type III secretion protein J